MTKLLKTLGQNAQGMEEDYGVNRRHIEKFRQDRWGSTSREELQILMSLGDQYGVDFLTLETAEVWRSFAGTTAASFLSRDAHGIRQEDTDAMGFLLKEGIHLDAPDSGDIIAKMKTRNCVIIGSPKYNDACRAGLEALADSSKQPKGGLGTPFKFVWNDWQASDRKTPFCASAGANGAIGIEVLIEDGGGERPSKRKGKQINLSLGESKAVFLKADLPFGTTDYGWDYGVFVMCRKPFDTDADVTTVMLCGLSGFATKEIARELSLGLLFLHPKHVHDGRPVWRILRCPWKREGRSVTAHSRGRQWIDPADVKAVKAAAAESRQPPPGRTGEPDDEGEYLR
ncbi:MAG: hypothetical protein WC815_20150 [Vicinamibacterales bacterium]